MNVYQKTLLNGSVVRVYSAENKELIGGYDEIPDSLIIREDEDYHHKNYQVVILQKKNAISKIELVENQKNVSVSISDFKNIVIPVSYDTKPSALKISFVDDLAEPVEIKLVYEDSDHSKWDVKQAEKDRKLLLEKVSISVTTGTNLINVSFQPINDEYEYSKIELYSSGKQLMAKYKIEPDIYFGAVKDLAFGNYYVKLVQFNKNGDKLFESDFISVVLKEPNYGGKPTVII